MNIKPAREAPAPAPFQVIDGVTRPVISSPAPSGAGSSPVRRGRVGGGSTGWVGVPTPEPCLDRPSRYVVCGTIFGWDRFGITWLPSYPGVCCIRLFRSGLYRFAQLGRVMFRFR
jgi:hypothetical protein